MKGSRSCFFKDSGEIRFSRATGGGNRPPQISVDSERRDKIYLSANAYRDMVRAYLRDLQA